MNSRQKLVQQQYLNNEEAVIRRLKQVYGQSQKDIEDKIKNLTFNIGKLQQEYDWLDPNDPERAKVKSMIQSKIYQKQYQEQLKVQIDGILNQMQTKSYLTVSDYLDECYTDGFIGTIFDAHGQGVPIVTPIDQESLVRAVQLESKISKGLYTRLGEDVDLLKKKITAQVSRSISTGMTFAQTAKALENYSKIGYNNAIRIARTEGHRVQTTATMDAMTAAKEKGADVVKQWDATLDGATRPSHIAVDGEIRELDKPFSNRLDFPGDPHGKAAEVINCRCALLQRARWALDGGSFTKMNNFTKQLETFDSPDTYDKFKKGFFSPENKRYMNYVQQMEEKYSTKDFGKVLGKMTDLEYKRYSKLIDNNPLFNAGVKIDIPSEVRLDLERTNIEYREVQLLSKELSTNDIIQRLGGGDKTTGSCSSLGFAWIGNQHGLDVLDFRGGESCRFFARNANIEKIASLDGVKSKIVKVKNEIKGASDLLKDIDFNKHYYLAVGRHAAIVRKTQSLGLEYLELQTEDHNGFHPLTTTVLSRRFGATKSRTFMGQKYETTIVLIEADSLGDNTEFEKILGYINTSENKQEKGVGGHAK